MILYILKILRKIFANQVSGTYIKNLRIPTRLKVYLRGKSTSLACRRPCGRRYFYNSVIKRQPNLKIGKIAMLFSKRMYTNHQ